MFKGIGSKKLAGLALAGIITVTGTMSAFASDLSTVRLGNPWSRPGQAETEKRATAVEAAMQKLVDAGTITQAQADAVMKIYIPAERKNPMDELVAAGTISQAQADAISKEIKSVAQVLKELVAAGAITQAQADAVTKAFVPKGRFGMDRGRGINPMEQLVTDGSITQAQADAIKTAIKEGRDARKTAAEVLKELVAAGTITQAQADTVSKLFIPGDKRDMKQIERKSPMDELVEAGTITQAQADAIKAAVDALKQK